MNIHEGIWLNDLVERYSDYQTLLKKHIKSPRQTNYRIELILKTPAEIKSEESELLKKQVEPVDPFFSQLVKTTPIIDFSLKENFVRALQKARLLSLNNILKMGR